jgi:cell division protein FtsL
MAALPRLHAVGSEASIDVPTRRQRPRRVEAPATRTRSRVGMAIWSVVLVFVVLFAAAAIQIRLISGQRQLDRIEQRISDAQVRQDSLRQKEASLRSPAQITQIAADQLGMVHAAPPLMVSPDVPHLGTATPATTIPGGAG